MFILFQYLTCRRGKKISRYWRCISYTDRIKKPGKISLETISDGVLKTVSEPDKDKIKIGNEYAGNGGLLSEFEPVYLEAKQDYTGTDVDSISIPSIREVIFRMLFCVVFLIVCKLLKNY